MTIKKATTRVMGVDPGLGITGYGLVESNAHQLQLVEAGVIRTNSRSPMEQRLVNIFTEMTTILSEFSPQFMVVEDLYAHYAQHRTAIIMGHARGVILLSAARQGIPVTSYSATRIKKSITGNGHATKEQVQQMVKRRLTLASLPKPPDVADALAAAICHLENIQR